MSDDGPFTIDQLSSDVEYQRRNVQQALGMWEESALKLIQGIVRKAFPDATGITYEVFDNDDPAGVGRMELTGVMFDATRLSGVDIEELWDELANEAILYELLERCPEYRDITELEFE
jgi:hypothetical protein